jgi:hypothetical protein
LTATAHGCFSWEQVVAQAASVGLLGLCSDLNSTYMQGPARAPAVLRAAIGCDSANPYAELGDCFTGTTICICWWARLEIGLEPFHARLLITETHLQRSLIIDIVQDYGDVTLETDISPDDADAAIEEAVAQTLAGGQAPLLMGGDHSVTFPAMRAIASHCRRALQPSRLRELPVAIVHFDAHPVRHMRYCLHTVPCTIGSSIPDVPGRDIFPAGSVRRGRFIHAAGQPIQPRLSVRAHYGEW